MLELNCKHRPSEPARNFYKMATKSSLYLSGDSLEEIYELLSGDSLEEIYELLEGGFLDNDVEFNKELDAVNVLCVGKNVFLLED